MCVVMGVCNMYVLHCRVHAGSVIDAQSQVISHICGMEGGSGAYVHTWGWHVRCMGKESRLISRSVFPAAPPALKCSAGASSPSLALSSVEL